ncbi:hypothetical protein LIA75_003448 [Vibrio fluvialis]|nr:hypothetical protein [Vibrio fluvialis]
MKQAQTRTTPLISLAFLVSALFSASSFASNSIERNDATADYAQKYLLNMTLMNNQSNQANTNLASLGQQK